MTAKNGPRSVTARTVDEPQGCDLRASQFHPQANLASGISQARQPTPAPIWSAEIPINQRELLRAELRLHKTHAVLDLRRRRLSPYGDLQLTERGFALAVRHLSAMKELIDAARAVVEGLLGDAS
jgi:hypothetical protein